MSTAELMLLTTWLNCGKRVIRKISNARSRASYGPYHGLELPNHGIKNLTVSSCSVWNSVKKFNFKSSCHESQVINIKLLKNQQKVPGPPPKLLALDWWICRNFQHWAHVNGTEVIWTSSWKEPFSSCTKAKPWMFDGVYIEGNQMKLFK